jgi:hypothetical protein
MAFENSFDYNSDFNATKRDIGLSRNMLLHYSSWRTASATVSDLSTTASLRCRDG